LQKEKKVHILLERRALLFQPKNSVAEGPGPEYYGAFKYTTL
jgi:hypothetical protein